MAVGLGGAEPCRPWLHRRLVASRSVGWPFSWLIGSPSKLLAFDEIQRLDQRFSTRSEGPQFVGDVLLFGNRRLLQSAFELIQFSAAMTSPFDFLLTFATSHFDGSNEIAAGDLVIQTSFSISCQPAGQRLPECGVVLTPGSR